MNRYEKQKKAIEMAIGEKIAEYKAIYKKAEDEDRDPTDDERLDIESCLKSIETLKNEGEDAQANINQMQRVDDLGRQLGPSVGGVEVVSGVVVGDGPVDRMVKSIGEQFTTSPGYKNAYEQLQKGSKSFTTGAVELQTKGTLLEGSGAPGSGTGGGLIPVPQVIPGVVNTLFQPLTVESLILSGQTDSNTVRYVVEGTATNSAAAVAEAGTKPESTLALSTKDESVKKLATVLTVSDEMLEDVQQVQSYINGRLSLFVQIQSEASIVSGAGTNDLAGILDASRSINVLARGTVDNNAVCLFKAMNGQRGSAFLEPDFIVMNPANWQATRLLTDTAGQFFGGGPFQGPYGAGSNMQASGQIVGPNDSLWGKPVIVSTAVGVGTALVGTTSAAQVWSKGGLTVEATNAHSTYFTSNLVAIRAERRLALALYRASAFTKVTGLS